MKVTLNFASRRYVNRRALNQLGILLLLLLLGVLFFQLSGYLQSRSQLQKYEKNLTELRQEYQQLLGETPQSLNSQLVEEQNIALQQAATLLKRDAFRWTALFDRMEERLPSGVTITGFSPDYKTQSLNLSGLARDLSDLQSFLNSLHKDSFDQVFLQNQNQVKVSDGQGGEMLALGFNVKLEGVF